MIGLDSASLEFGLKALLTLFVVIDPAGLVPVFVSLAGGRSAKVQATIARRAVLIAAAVLLLFSLIGGPVLAYLGISVAALRVAGGILLFRIAVDMVFAQFRRETTEEGLRLERRRTSRSFRSPFRSSPDRAPWPAS